MGRREFISLVGGATAALGGFAYGQQPLRNTPLVGALWLGAPSARIALKLQEAFRRGLREGGFTEGTNITMEHRYYSDGIETAAADLVRIKPNVIFAVGTPGYPGGKARDRLHTNRWCKYGRPGK
jgi:hypothetical protein